MSRYDAILFDFDGVLVDSEPVHWQCWSEVLAPAGIVLDWQTYERECIGVTDRAMLEALAPLANPPVTVDSLWPRYAEKRSLFRERMKAADCADQATLDLIASLEALASAQDLFSAIAEIDRQIEMSRRVVAFLEAEADEEDIEVLLLH